MSHVGTAKLHGYVARATSILLDIDTANEAADLSSIRFQVGAGIINKTGLSATDVAGNVQIEVDLTASDMTVTAGTYAWEAIATISGQDTTLAGGSFRIDSQLTTTN